MIRIVETFSAVLYKSNHITEAVAHHEQKIINLGSKLMPNMTKQRNKECARLNEK